MPVFKVAVVQTYRVVRTIEVDVEAEDKASAVERVASGDEEVPEFVCPDWCDSWELQDEHVSQKR